MPEFDRYFAEGGDEKFRYDYNISRSDVVVDAGAYHGLWSKKIHDRYRCRILAFEPVFHEIARNNLINTNAILNTVGLGSRNEMMDICVAGDATSTYRGNATTKVQIRDFIEVMNEYHVDHVKLLKINIEGGEYDLLEHIIAHWQMTRVTYIQVQFHDFMENAVQRRQAIHDGLRRTHHLTYNFEFVWENWALL